MNVESGVWDLLVKGGPIVGVLLVFSVAGVAIVGVKLYQFAVLQLRSRGFVEPALDAFTRGDVRGALAELGASRNPIARAMEAAIRGLQHGRHREEAVREEVARVGSAQIARLESYLRGLETIGSLSPLLGLLGTVLGMITAFQRLEEAGARVDPSMLSAGIWEALLTTAVGLLVAIPAMLALTWLESEVDRVRRDMGDAVTRIFTLGHDEEVALRLADEGAPLGSEPQHAL